MNRTDIAGGLIIFIFASWMCRESSMLPIFEKEFPASGFLPFVISICMMAVSLLLVGQGLLRASDRHVSIDWPSQAGFKRILVATLAFAGYIFLIGFLGYLVTTILFFVVLIRMLSSYRWLTVITISTLSAFAFQILFVQLLGVPLPIGKLF